MIKNTIVILACSALIAPLAFAQTRSTHERQTTTATEQPITVTGTIITTTEEGSAAKYQPVKTLVVREDRSNTPGSYVLNGPGHVVNKNGEVIQTAIKPGTRVRVYYVNTGDLRVVDHVVVDWARAAWNITNKSRTVPWILRLFGRDIPLRYPDVPHVARTEVNCLTIFDGPPTVACNQNYKSLKLRPEKGLTR